MKQYLDYLQHILTHGTDKPDRTGTGTKSLFGYQMRFNLAEGFPLVTTKKLHFRSIVHELLWFLHGETNVKTLRENGVTIWDEWANADGELGPIYGKQWRAWETTSGQSIDQMQQLIEQIQTSPHSRRLMVSAWNVSDLPSMALPPCHLLFQFYINNGCLSCQLYQRSADSFLGVPFNIASYALLTHMIAAQCSLKVGEFIWTGGDCHLYNNHLELAAKQLTRTPLPLPQLSLKRQPPSLFDYEYDDIELLSYLFHPSIPATVAV